MRIVCLSDTHMHHRKLTVPDGDVLVHTGDFTRKGSEADIADFNAWLGTLPHAHKVVIAGNHDFLFAQNNGLARALLFNATYLQDASVEVAGVKFWGSPWQPWFYNWAFNLPRGTALAQKWALIPPDTDVLLTHGPPFGVLDLTDRGEPVGCEELRQVVVRLSPRLHVFGHIHEAYGEVGFGRTWCVNASNCTLQYRPEHAPIVVDLPCKGGQA